MILRNTELRLSQVEATFCWTRPFFVVPRFYLDILDDTHLIQDLEGIDFADRESAIAEAVAGARPCTPAGAGFRHPDGPGGRVPQCNSQPSSVAVNMTRPSPWLYCPLVFCSTVPSSTIGHFTI